MIYQITQHLLKQRFTAIYNFKSPIIRQVLIQIQSNKCSQIIQVNFYFCVCNFNWIIVFNIWRIA